MKKNDCKIVFSDIDGTILTSDGVVTPDTREMMQNELLNLWKVEKKMVVFITHSVNEAVKLADKVVVLGAGHVLKEVKIDLDRPRDKQSPQFIAYAQEFRKLIHGEDGSEEEMREEEEKCKRISLY